jgi:hypothetical protein
MVLPSADGYTYLTPDYYANGEIARSQLALSITPNTRIEIPLANIPNVNIEVGIVEPWAGQPGGGNEVKVPAPVPVSRARYVPID